MKDFSIKSVLEKMPSVIMYFLVGTFTGVICGYFLFYFSKSFYQYILSLWFKRILFGVKFLGNQYIFWFILNNFVSMIVLIAASFLLIINIAKSRERFFFKRFKNLEKKNPKITLFSLYMVPIGALIINGFLISFFLTFTFFEYGIDKLSEAIFLMLPHGMNELLALFFAASLGLSYLKILEPIILKGKWDESIRLGKKLLFSKTTFFFLILISILVIFGGFVEGTLTQLGTRS